MIKLLKTNDKHKTISFCVLTPNMEDGNGDIISEDEIIKTAHDFGANMNSKFLNIDHEDGTNISRDDYEYVESFITPVELKIGDSNIVSKGSWYVGIKFHNQELYEAVKRGDFIGVSMGGYFINNED